MQEKERKNKNKRVFLMLFNDQLIWHIHAENGVSLVKPIKYFSWQKHSSQQARNTRKVSSAQPLHTAMRVG